MRWAVISLGAALCHAQGLPGPQTPVAHFGTTVVRSIGFRGEIYVLPPQTEKLPPFGKLQPEGAIYTSKLDVPPMDFSAGFPGVTGRFEWFAIDYTAKVWVDLPGKYRFALLSDDGSKLYIDRHKVIDNYGIHPPQSKTGHTTLKKGFHQIRVSYFQGPRMQVALVLSVAAPGETFHIFDADEFIPPPDSR